MGRHLLHSGYCPCPLAPTPSLSDSPLGLHKVPAAEVQGMTGGLVCARATHFSSFDFLPQSLVLFQGKTAQGSLWGCGPLREVWPAANLTLLLTWLWSQSSPFTVSLMLASSFLKAWGLPEVRDRVHLSWTPQGPVVPGTQWAIARVCWTEMDSLCSFELLLSRNSPGWDYLVKRHTYFWDLILWYCIYLCTFLDCVFLQGLGSLFHSSLYAAQQHLH